MPFSEASTWEASISGVSDGNNVNAANTNAAPQKLTNRTKYLRDHSAGARDVTQWSIPLFNKLEETGIELWALTTEYAGFRQIDTPTGGGTLMIEFSPPAGVTITEVRVRFHGNSPGSGGAHIALPTSLPLFALQEQNPATGSVSTIASQGDASPNLAAYDVAHWVTLAGLTKVVDPTKRYFITVAGEYGTNALVGRLGILGATVSWTAPASE